MYQDIGIGYFPIVEEAARRGYVGLLWVGDP